MKTYTKHASSRVLRNEWQTTGTFPFQAKFKKQNKKTLKKGTFIAYREEQFDSFDSGCLCC